ncbi:hypothetical protein GOV05_02625 [Candidatus Woesearchaeota archaeon]|nr:hypothetical protein [Candidatus Woesearchaeota archaeon]
MKKTAITLAALLSIATSAQAADFNLDEDLTTALSALNAPKATQVEGVSQKGGLIKVLEIDGGLLAYDGEAWNDVKDETGQNLVLPGYTGITEILFKSDLFDKGDVLVADQYSVEHFRPNSDGALSQIGNYVLDNPGNIAIEDIGNGNPQDKSGLVFTDGQNMYSGLVEGNTISISPTPLPGESLDSVIGEAVFAADIMPGRKIVVVSDNTYNIIKIDKKTGDVKSVSYANLTPDDVILLPAGAECTVDEDCLSNSCVYTFDPTTGDPGYFCN